MSHLPARRIAHLLLPYLALVAIHLLSGMQMEQPIVLADEVGYLGNARYLSGTAHLPDMRNSQFYHFGYSLMLLPAFWLFAEPVAIYKAAVTINALLASALYFPLLFILTSFMEVPRSTARWIAFACCLYPSAILYSSFAWSENAFIPFYALAAALFGKYLASRSWRDALLFSFVAGFLYTIHPRALPVLVIVLLYLLVLVLLRAVSVSQLLLGASTMGAVFVLTRVVNGHLKAVGWAGSGEFSATQLAGRLLPDSSDFLTLIERALGQVLYLAQASHGLFLLGLAAVAWLILKNAARGSLRRVLTDPKTGVPIFVAITAGGIFAASCTLKLYSIHGPDGIRGADFIHGRYNEAFAVLFIAFALAEYSWRKFRIGQLVRRGIGVAATILLLTVVVMIEVDDARVRHVAGVPGAEPAEKILPSDVGAVNVPGVYPLVDLVGALDLYSVSLAVMISFLAIFTAMRVSQRVGTVLLMLVFSFFSLYNYLHFLSPFKAGARPRLTFAAQASRLGPLEAVSYDVAYLDRAFLFGLQYLLPQTVFDRFDSRKGRTPKSEVVISGDDWQQAGELGARFVFSSSAGNQALWVLPGQTLSRMPAASYDGVTLGTKPLFGIRESGFYRPGRFRGAPARWTDGAATLKVPLDPARLPRRLEIETATRGRTGVRLQLLANGVELWNGAIPAVWSETFSLERVPLADELLLELASDTFSPAESVAGSQDRRRLGVMVRGIRLLAAE